MSQNIALTRIGYRIFQKGVGESVLFSALAKLGNIAKARKYEKREEKKNQDRVTIYRKLFIEFIHRIRMLWLYIVVMRCILMY